MVLPANFGTWEHLSKIVKTVHNWRVRDFWKHQRYDNHENEPNIARAETNLLQATKILPNDSAVIMLLKIFLFEICLGNAARLQPALYGIPVNVYDEYTMEGKPEVMLLFEEDIEPEPNGFARIQAEIKFKLMDETSETITQAKIQSIANKIKLAFGGIPTWDFMKGKNIYTYQDRKKGYWLQIYALDESNAEQLARKVITIQDHTFENEKFKVSIPKRNSNSTPGTRMILGKPVKKKRYRPEKKVRFRYAQLKIDGLADPIVLYDPYHRLNKADLISA